MQRHTAHIHENTLPNIKYKSIYHQPPLVIAQRKRCDSNVSSPSVPITIRTEPMINRSYVQTERTNMHRTGRTTTLPSFIKQSNPRITSHTTIKQINPLKLLHQNTDEKLALDNMAVIFWGVLANVIYFLRT